MDTPGPAAASVTGRILAVLRAVAAGEPEGATTSAIGRTTRLPRPTAHRVLMSLLDEGVVDREPGGGRWVLGPELFLLGAAAAARYDVTEIALPHVRRLALATGESAFFSVRRGDETVCLVREDGAFPLRSHVLHEGARFPLGVVSAGMVLLAHCDDATVEAYLERSNLAATHGPQHDVASVRRHVEATRLTGYALNPGLVVPGSWGMAAAVFDTQGRAQWALSLTGVEARFREPRQSELGTLLLREAHVLTTSLGSPRR